MNMMSEDAKAILLLCAHFGKDTSMVPLDLRDYNKVVRWLMSVNLR